MRQIFKRFFYDAMHVSGITGVALRRNRRCVPVLLYHGVTDQRWPGVLDCEKKHIRAERFEQQLAFLKEHFQVIPLARYAAALRGGAALPEGCAVITFDDGYADNYTTVFPLLRRYGLPATMFLAADFVTKGTPLWVDRLAWAFDRTQRTELRHPVTGSDCGLATEEERINAYLLIKRDLKAVIDAQREDLADRVCRELLGAQTPPPPSLYAPLTKEQVREMADSGFMEIGSHGCRHAILTAMSQEEARREIVDSKAALEEFCGRPIESFSYPNGDHNPAVARLTAEAGYACAVAGGLRLNRPESTQPYAISRLALAESDSRSMMAATLCGIRGRLISLAGASA